MSALSIHSGAIACLGQPIKQRGFRLSDSENFLNSEQAQFKVSVKGPLDKGERELKLDCLLISIVLPKH